MCPCTQSGGAYSPAHPTRRAHHFGDPTGGVYLSDDVRRERPSQRAATDEKRGAAGLRRTPPSTDEASGPHRALCLPHTDAQQHAAARDRLRRAGNPGKAGAQASPRRLRTADSPPARNGRLGNLSLDASARTTVTGSSRKRRRSTLEPSQIHCHRDDPSPRRHQVPGQCTIPCPDVEDEITGYDA